MRLKELITEELEQFEWDKDKVAGKPVTPRYTLFHMSLPKFRNQILQQGLQPRVGEVYGGWTNGKKAIPAIFATNGSIWDIIGQGGNINNLHEDLWVIDNNTNNEWFEDNHFNNMGFKHENKNIVTFTPIPASALRLVHKGT